LISHPRVLKNMSKLNPDASAFVPKRKLQAGALILPGLKHHFRHDIVKTSFPRNIRIGHKSETGNVKWEYNTLYQYILKEFTKEPLQAKWLSNWVLHCINQIKLDDFMVEAIWMAPYVAYDMPNMDPEEWTIDPEEFAATHQVWEQKFEAENVKYVVNIKFYAAILESQDKDEYVNGEFRKNKNIWHKGGITIKQTCMVDGKPYTKRRFQVLKWEVGNYI
jgi:hypothetical protein